MRQRKQFVCRECGLMSPRWLGRCPECGAWHTLEERTLSPVSAAAPAVEGEEVVAAAALDPQAESRFATGFGELDRVLGGGLVPGSLVLIGGDPGIGKSTLALQVAAWLSSRVGRVLYVSGEESSGQLALRARRLGIATPGLYFLCTGRWQRLAEAVEELRPLFMVVDSVQSIYREEIGAVPGTVTQVRECTAQLLRLAKGRGICVFLIGHVTKDGVLAGPRLLEHMVDTVLYFEGERHQSYRLLRGVKNRFGSTNEIGIFEMGPAGLTEVSNPSSLFLRQGAPEPVPGAVVTATLEGNRPLLVEIQALVCPTGFGTPRRMTTGVEYNRLVMILAVLEKRLGLHLGGYDAYVNAVGGVRLTEPAADLAVALAVASSFRDQVVVPDLVAVGEIGLTGEIRPVTAVDKRVREAAKLGFRRMIIPAGSRIATEEGLQVVRAGTLAEAVALALY